MKLTTQRGKNRKYCANVVALDIETTVQDGYGIVYSIAIAVDYTVYRFRFMHEAISFLQELGQDNPDINIIVYVYNLQYEWQFIKNYINDLSDVICVSGPRDILTFTAWGNVIFRCYRKLAPGGVAKISARTKYEKPKDFDYKKVRHSLTKLTDEELHYIDNDVLIIVDHFNNVFRDDYKTPEQTPLTETSITRRELFKEARAKENKQELKEVGQVKVSLKELSLQLDAFNGGFTHANPLYAMQTLKNVNSIDLTSAYPSVMVAKKFPMKKKSEYEEIDEESYKEIIKKYCAVAQFTFYNIESKDNINMISKHKIISYDEIFCENGKLVRGSKVTIAGTEIDYYILNRVYEWESLKIEYVYTYERKKLPKYMAKTIIEKYGMKTELKGVEGKEKEYAHSKTIINALFGVCCSNPLRDQVYPICEDEITYIEKIPQTETSMNEALDKYNNKKSRTTVYLWGAYITAYVRYLIVDMIEGMGVDNWVYSDTDSCKTLLSMGELNTLLNEINAKIEDEMKKAGEYYGFTYNQLAPQDIKGNRHFLGIWDNENESANEYKYELFKTLGAKRYMIQEGGKLEITVAGLPKSAVKYFEEKEKPFEVFNENLCVPKEYTNKLMKKYYENPIEMIPVTDYNGVEIHQQVSSAVELSECEFTINIKEDYINFIFEDCMNKIRGL